MLSTRHNLALDPQTVDVRAGSAFMEGELYVPRRPMGLVVFLSGGDSRRSPTDRMIAEGLHKQGFAALLLDLFTSEERAREIKHGTVRLNVESVARRIVQATNCMRRDPIFRGLPTSFIATGSAAAAALVAAADIPSQVSVVVCRGGRPDLARTALTRVKAPTLFIVRSSDHNALQSNHYAFEQLRCPKELHVIADDERAGGQFRKIEQLEEYIVGWLYQHSRPETRTPQCV